MDEDGPAPRSNLRIVAAAVLASLATAVVLAAVVLFVRRDDNAPIRVLLPPPAERTSTAGLQTTGLREAGRAEAQVRVHVSGAVRTPGVYTLQQNARVEDAVKEAGGFTDDAAKDAVNLAIRVRDEGQYHIPRLGETPPAATAPAAGQPHTSDSSATGASLIDLNTAAVGLLDTLPSIGPVKAQAIVGYRQENGSFKAVEEIMNVPGIGPTIHETIRDLVTVGNGQ